MGVVGIHTSLFLSCPELFFLDLSLSLPVGLVLGRGRKVLPSFLPTFLLPYCLYSFHPSFPSFSGTHEVWSLPLLMMMTLRMKTAATCGGRCGETVKRML